MTLKVVYSDLGQASSSHGLVNYSLFLKRVFSSVYHVGVLYKIKMHSPALSVLAHSNTSKGKRNADRKRSLYNPLTICIKQTQNPAIRYFCLPKLNTYTIASNRPSTELKLLLSND